MSGTALTLLEGMERQERELQLAFAKRNADEGATPYIRNIIE